MASKSFGEVFENIELSEGVKRAFEGAMVSKIVLNTEKASLSVVIDSARNIDEKYVDSFREELGNSFGQLKERHVHINYLEENEKRKLRDFWANIIYMVDKISPFCSGILKNAKRSVEDNVLTIKVDYKTAYVFKAKKIDELIENTLKERLNLDYRVQIVNADENVRVAEGVIEAEKEIDEQRVRATEYAAKMAEIQSHKPARLAKSKLEKIDNDEILPIDGNVVEDCVVCFEGKIVACETKETKKGNTLVMFDIADATDAVSAKVFFTPENKTPESMGLFKVGKYIRAKGKIQYDTFENELVLMAKEVNKGTAPVVRQDNAPVKRVELHLHTKMSSMDGITSAADYIRRAAYWNHSAIAITDHGVVQAYPEAMNAAADIEKSEGKHIKVLYGCEAYLVDDMGTIAKNSKNQSLRGEYVVFDLETTGLKKETDRIIEIGAVKIIDGKLVDTFSTFIDPHISLSEKIVSLTGITDDMLKGQRDVDEVLPEFLEFVGNAVMVAHNAAFDMGFIRKWTSERQIALSNSVMDTVELARMMFPELKNHKLDTICEHLGVSLENHHRAVDDATATAEAFAKCIEILENKDIHTLDEVNALASELIDRRKIKNYYHAIIFVKNQVGLRNLYELVSKAHIEYYLKRPKLPKSELMKLREGLIIGSACEAGELYTAIYENQPDEVIQELVDFYDYLEIQPLGNNEFMINNQSRNGKSVESEERLKEINRKIVELGKKNNKLVVATGDCHFLDKEDEFYRRIIQTAEGFSDVDNQAPLYYRTTEEMLEEFKYLGEETAYEVVVENTNKIADMLDEVRPIPKGTYPPKIDGADDDLRNITTTRAKELYGDPLPDIVAKRLERELNCIISNGYAVLYIIAQKLVWNSNDNGYIVGSRGSVGSSFAATMAGITEVNPLEPHYRCPKCKYSDFESDTVKAYAGNSGFDLPDMDCPVCGTKLSKDGQAIPFETFLGFNGDKEPDIDLNFSGEYQQDAHRYCETLFGDGHVFKAGTIGTVAEKTAYGFVLKYAEQRGLKMRKAQMNRLKMGCVGIKRTTGQHPGGLIVVPQDNSIFNFCPVQRPANDFESIITTTHFDYHSIHSNLLKLDMLGHDVPTILRMFHDITGFNPLDVPMDDKATLSLFQSPEALGVTREEIDCNTGSFGLPEFGTQFVRQMLEDTKPETFSELVRISGLSHGTDVWIGNAQEIIKEGTATLKEIIPTRDDIMVYLIQKGVENLKAFTIMEMVRKGKGLKPEDEEIMIAHDVPQWYIDSCKKIKYMFPKGHAVAYVTNTFRIGYFKINYPYAFYAATFSVKVDDFDYNLFCFGKDRVLEKMQEFKSKGKDNMTAKEKGTETMLELVREMYARGLKFARIDLYESDAVKFRVVEDGLLPPLCTLPGLGGNAAKSIVEARKDGEFETIEQLQERTTLGKSTIQLLRESGVLDGMRETDQLTLF